MREAEWRGALCGLAAAASFGISAPLAKVLLGHVSPTLLAGLLYLGAALALWVVRVVRPASTEAPLMRGDIVTLVAIILFGGALGPVLMLLGLRQLSALSGSLLLNLEAPFTMLLAVLVFREHLGKRAAVAAGLILCGAALLKQEPGQLSGSGQGALLIAAACLCWALDNNLTQRLSLRDPFAVVRFKATGAALTNLSIAVIWQDAAVPQPNVLAATLALGSVSYGASVVLDAYALRWIGAAREAAYFATAPFLGALLSLALFDEPLRVIDGVALLSMLAGVALLMRARHAHFHVHTPLEHAHVHTHDAHHQHAHASGDPTGEPHAHSHHHDVLSHEHEHVSDTHHRHEHP